MSRVDRMIATVAPGWALRREQARTEAIQHREVQKVLNQGYGSHGASRSRNGLKAFTPSAGSAKTDIIDNLKVLRPRSRDLFMGGALANGALKTMRTNVVGTGLKLKPAFDAEFLGLNPDQASAQSRQIRREWELWADSKDCDANGLHDFSELQQLAFLSWLMSGDVFALLPDIERKHATYKLRVRLVEADRVANPTVAGTENGKKIVDGVEVDADGMIVAYWVADKHLSGMEAITAKFNRVLVRGEESGRRNMLHLMDSERPDQYRGVPILAPVIEALKQLERYTDAELMSAVISSMFTVFIKKSPENRPEDFSLGTYEDNPYNEPLADNGGDLAIGNGTVQFLEEGEEAQFANPSRPYNGFEPFIMAIVRQIGSSLEIPSELLLKTFTASYSASRGALLEAWKMFRMRRSWMTNGFCQPIYEEWFAEAVIAGRIDAPGFFDSELIRRAYTRAEWHGPSFGTLDPVKEVQAASMRVQNGISTREKEAMEIAGSDFETNARQLAYENEVLGRAQVAAAQQRPRAPDPQDDEDKDDEEGGEQQE